MQRRALLASMASLGGCLASPASSGPTTQPPSGTSTPSPRSGDVGCPPPLSSDSEAVCAGSGEDAAIRTTASPPALTLPRDRTRLTLRNGSDEPVHASPYDPRLYAWADGRWEYVVRKSSAGVGRTPVELAPGESRRWTLVADTADLDAPNPPSASDGDPTLTLRFTPGTYAFGVPATPAGDDRRRLYVARFSVGGAAPPLVPTDAVVTHDREGDALRVRTRTERRFDNSHPVTLHVDRLGSPPSRSAALRLFELYNPHYESVPSLDADRVFVDWLLTVLLRDAFALVEPSDERVRVETVDTSVPPLGLDADESLDVTFRGEAWRLSSSEGWVR